MSNLLNEAIIDAKALREAALKNAETVVIEKYSQEVKETLEQLLEQDELALDMGGEMGAPEAAADPAADPLAADPAAAPELPAEEPAMAEGEVEEIDEDGDIPLAATNDFADLDGKNLGNFPKTGEEVDVTINLGALQEMVEGLTAEEEMEIDENALADLIAEAGPQCEDDDVMEEDAAGDAYVDSDGDEAAASGIETSAQAEEDENALKQMEETRDLDELLDAVMERLTVDMGATLSGWAGRSSEDVKWELKKALAHRRSTDVEEELKDLKKAHDELVFENKQLDEQNSQYKQAFNELKESLQDVNLSNARLLYTNRVLRNTSLNERQKSKIVEAISIAGSVTEAKTIYETLQSTVEAQPKRSPQSLSEAIGRRSSVIRATRKETSSEDPYADRMKRLAGIK